MFVRLAGHTEFPDEEGTEMGVSPPRGRRSSSGHTEFPDEEGTEIPNYKSNGTRGRPGRHTEFPDEEGTEIGELRLGAEDVNVSHRIPR